MQRIPEVSIMQTLGAILVCAFHAMAGVAEYSLPYNWIHIFVIPLFIHLSGYLFSYTHGKDRPPVVFLRNKLHRLLLPYFVISTLVFVPKCLLSDYAMRPLEFSFSGYLRMLFMPYDNVIVYYWFIPTLFVVLLLSYLFFRYLPASVLRPPAVLVFFVLLYFISPAASLRVLNIGEAVESLVFFALGYYSCMWQVPTLVRGHDIVLFIGSLLLSLAFALFNYNALSEFMGAITGIIMCLSLASLYLRFGCYFLKHLEGAYFTIYLLAWFPQVAVTHLLGGENSCVPPCVIFLVSLLSGIYIPLLVHRLYFQLRSHKN